MRMQQRTLASVRRIAAAVVALASGLVIVSAQSSDTFVPVTDAMLEDPAPGDWLTWRRTADGWGYSPLDDRFIINTSDDVYVFGLDAETGELAWETQIFALP